jgi:hypothetical protein
MLILELPQFFRTGVTPGLKQFLGPQKTADVIRSKRCGHSITPLGLRILGQSQLVSK